MLECTCLCVCCDVQVFLLPDESAAAHLICPSCGRHLAPARIGPFREAEWLACNVPQLLVQWREDGASDRKRRLFGCACCRLVWEQLTDPFVREGVVVAERFADGLATRGELRRARRRVIGAHPFGLGRLLFNEVAVGPLVRAVVRLRPGHGWEQAEVAALYRDVVGNPFRPVVIAPAVLAWNEGTVRRLAQAIYDERAFDRLPLLADALEEAGCDDADVLAHCRGPRPHVRGCWVVDLLLGKT